MFRREFAAMVALTVASALGAEAAGSGKAGGCAAGQGQLLIDAGRYEDAIREFTCVIQAQPTGVEGYRGRIEAQLLLRRYADAVRDYARMNAVVVPVHPDARNVMLAGYDARLAAAPDDIAALTGASATYWWFFDYAPAIHLLNQLLEVKPDDPYGNLYRGSSRFLLGGTPDDGALDLENAIALDPLNPHVRFIVADAYTYGHPDPDRAFAEATLALEGGLATPRVHAILAASYQAFGDLPAAAAHIKTHFDLVTSQLLAAPSLAAGGSRSLDLVPGRSYQIPVPAITGEVLSIRTSSPAGGIWDSIIVLLDPSGTPVVGSDDFSRYFAGFNWAAEATGTYQLRVTSFESVSTGQLLVTRR